MSFRLDRTAFHLGSHVDTKRYHAAQAPAALAGRLRAAAFLRAAAWLRHPKS